MTDATNGEALLPCPFCPAGKPVLYKPTCHKDSEYDPLDRAFPWVRCKCGVEVHGDNWDHSGKSAIVAWNRRQPTAPAGMVVVPRERLQTALARAKVFDDGADGADAESARSVAAIISSLLAAHESPTDSEETGSKLVERRESPNLNELSGNSGQLWEPGRLPPIDTDVEYDRHYIPLPGGWEMQTKGKGSSFRLCDTKSGRRMVMTGHRFEHEELERMAREIHAAWNKSPNADTTPDVSERGPTDNVDGE